ncbi:nadph oxidase [Anaeramoeba flamelloides]|uniref:Nadph oxidase n=1 Tax=Anaeramoeba flamelloides TaxID=1746091 RepID=A0AAV7ZKL1_9EUKA|nr:nadph oxidase [Anaeramoeba flamelloides]
MVLKPKENLYKAHTTKRFQLFHHRYLITRPKKASKKTKCDFMIYKLYFIVLFIFAIGTLLTSLSLPIFKIVTRITESMCGVTSLTLFLSITHYSFHHKFFHSSYDHTLWLHKKAGKHTIKLININGLLHLLAILFSQLPIHGRWADAMPSKRTSLLAISATIIIKILKKGIKVRKKNYEFFYYSHIITTFAYVPVFAFAHPIKPFLITAGLGFVLWLLDLVYRVVQYFFLNKGTIVKVVSQRDQSNYQPDSKILIIEMDDFNYEPMQWVKLCIPSISKYQMHALSICSQPTFKEPESGKTQIKILIKNFGDWSKTVLDKQDSFLLKKPVIIEGPYGSPSLSVLDYRYLVLIGGGSGVGPVLSLLLSLMELSKKQFDQQLVKLKFYWIAKEFQNLELIQNELEQAISSNKKYQIEVYVTRQNKLQLEKDYPIPNYTKFEKPNVSRLITDASKEAKNNNLKKMAIFSCGPPRLVNEIKCVSFNLSNSNFYIDISQELYKF